MLSIWGTARAGGGGAILADVSKVSGIKPAQGGDLGWAVVAMVTAILEPYAFLDAVRKNEANFGDRAGAVFARIAFMLSYFGMVVAFNCGVAGIDLAALLPRWFTIRRRGFLTIVFVFVMQPLSLLNSASNFRTVVGSFNVFLGPLTGIMFADDFLIRKRTMKLTGL
ncbi:NCS1 nucleoside transporter [Colletotrichum scovillei]|nr:NCS1 nucleoside transporter [Colletotrichum scovillei]